MLGFLKKDKNTVSAIIVAAGNSSRMKNVVNKQLMEINGKPVIAHTLLAFQRADIIDEIIVVTKEADILILSDIAKEFGIDKVTEIVKGGATRTDSVKNGILCSHCDFVAIHDGARPCITVDEINSVVKAGIEYGAAILGCPVTDTLKKADINGVITKTVDRDNLFQIQTPQVFKKSDILYAYENTKLQSATDDCMLMEEMGINVTVVTGKRTNIKITVDEDIKIATSLLSED